MPRVRRGYCRAFGGKVKASLPSIGVGPLIEARGQLQVGEVLLSDFGDDGVPGAEIPFADEGEGGAAAAGASGPADPVDVLLGILGHVVVDDVLDIGNVQAASSNIGGHQEIERARAEIGHDAIALALAEVAMDSLGGDAGRLELSGETVDADLGVAEDKRAAEAALFVDMAERGELVALGDFAVDLFDALGGALFGVDGHAVRAAHVAVDQAADALGHGGTEERGLAFLRNGAEDVIDIAGKPDIEHLIGFIQDDEVNGAEFEGATLEVVDDAPGRADNNVGALLEAGEVGLDAASANKSEGEESVEAAEVVEHIADLVGKFAGGNEDNSLDFAAGGIDGARKGKAEGNRLAGAGLGEADHVFAIEEHGEGLALDGGGIGIAEGGDGLEAGFIDTESAEGLGEGCKRGREGGAAAR